MKQKFDILDSVSFFSGLVFFAPVALFVRTYAGVSTSQFFLLQAILSLTVFVSEIPTGFLTDHIGYRNSLISMNFTIWIARILLFIAFLQKNFFLFVLEAIIEGIGISMESGTLDAYIYDVYGKENYIIKNARVFNDTTAGIIFSTITYALIYAKLGLGGLLFSTVITQGIAFFLTFFLPSASTKKQKKQNLNPCLFSDVFRNKKTYFFILLSSCFTVSYLFIHFFYAEKLILCKIDIKLLSPIILLYSLVEMSAKQILLLLKEKQRPTLFFLSALLGGCGFLLFSLTNEKAIILPLMLFLPLCMNLLNLILRELENIFIDEIRGEMQRAALLSILSVGANLFDILALITSALLAGIGISICFAVIGILFIFIALFFAFNLKFSSSNFF